MPEVNEAVAKFKVVDHTGTHDVTLGLRDYQEAADNKMSLKQYLMCKYPVGENQVDPLTQMIAQAGIRVRADAAHGIQASNMKEIIQGINFSAGPLLRNDGTDRHSIAGRLLYPEVIMQLINEGLVDNKEDYLSPWESAIALRSTVTQARVDQPTIDVTAPRASEATAISQLSLPTTMITVTLNSRQYAIPTKSIGVEIADEALQSTTIDRLGIMLTQQAIGERIRRIEEDMSNIINGDTDLGIVATPSVSASTFDATIPGTNPIVTKKAFVKWLRDKYQKMSISHILMDLDSALAIDEKLANNTLFSNNSAFAVRFSVANLGIPDPVFLILPTDIVGANTLVGFDSRFALHEITNISASYSAVEQFVMRRATGMRFDFGVALFKLQPDAFTGMVMGA